jgi:dTDP-4-dehydrorhamnose 3,5-epimerase
MSIETPKIIRRKCFYDKRGYLQEIYLKKKEKKIFKFSLVTHSKKHVFRGFHFQLKNQQEKLVYLVKGNILDIIINLRKKSKNFGKVYKFKLKEKNILYIPKGFAHGYLSRAPENIVLYYMTNYRDIKNEDGIVWNDKTLKIKFPTKKIIVSNKDRQLQTFENFIKSNKSL